MTVLISLILNRVRDGDGDGGGSNPYEKEEGKRVMSSSVKTNLSLKCSTAHLCRLSIRCLTCH